jgi:hypothetical protein
LRLQASLLSVFVPQLCPATAEEPLPHVCTTYENFHNLTPYNKAVLAINFVTLGFFVIVQCFFGAREYWCIDAFDLDEALPGDNLSEELELYPTFKKKLADMNLAAYILSAALILLVLG